MSLREDWGANAGSWVRWAREPGHDMYWQFHGRRFLEILPPPGRLTLDVGCGEGRVGRDLMGRGHEVVAVDASFALAEACATATPSQPTIVADAASLPLRSGCADLVVAFMSLQDVDDLDGAMAASADVLARDGALCLAIVHPINSAGHFEGDDEDRDAPFVIKDSYLQEARYSDDVERDGLSMTFHSIHRPLEAYTAALDTSGFTIDSVREVTADDPTSRWSRVPLFLHIAARRC